MRNLFDQYRHPENRLTHSLVSSLSNDPKLLSQFIRWATGERRPVSKLGVVEQTLPGEEEPTDEEESERRGLPDGWIYDGNGWCLIIESKIESPLTQDQLQRHRRTAERRGFSDVRLLALVTNPPKLSHLNSTVTIKRWTQLYCWLRRERKSEWAGRVTSYMEVLEQKLVTSNYLRGGTLTVFSGIPFGSDEPYNYFEAKRLLRLAMDDLRKRSDLRKQLGADWQGKGRSAITGRETTRVWDFLRLSKAKDAKSFTDFPHLTLSIHDDRLIAIVTVPNAIKGQFRAHLLSGGKDQFCALFRRLLHNISKALKGVNGAVPWVEILQRRYPSQRSEPIIDATLQFDLRTAFGDHQPGIKNLIKHQGQWLDATYDALSKRNSNLQLAVGAIFPFDRCPDVRKAEILNHVANVWLGCKPLIDVLIGR